MDAFLAEINLTEHATILDKLGYDDPNDFAEFEASDLEKLETRCTNEGMPPAHVDKIIRAAPPLFWDTPVCARKPIRNLIQSLCPWPPAKVRGGRYAPGV